MIVAIALGHLTCGNLPLYRIEIFLAALISALAWIRSAMLAMYPARRFRLRWIGANEEHKIWNYFAAVATAALALLQYPGSLA